MANLEDHPNYEGTKNFMIGIAEMLNDTIKEKMGLEFIIVILDPSITEGENANYIASIPRQEGAEVMKALLKRWGEIDSGSVADG